MTLLDRLGNDFWVTADRRFYFFFEMEDSHLENTISLLQRKVQYLQLMSGRDTDRHPINWLAQQPAYRGLVAEKRRRAAYGRSQRWHEEESVLGLLT
ncbi:hypothetical protein JCM17380_24550 [Desulfosporosinus burensis]